LSRAKTKALSGTVASLAALATIPVVFLGVLATIAPINAMVGGGESRWVWLGILAFGIPLVSAGAVFRAVYNSLCEQWSEEIVPPRLPRWIPLYRPL
jgi:hypothetical protein